MSASAAMRRCPFCGYLETAAPCPTCGDAVRDGPLGPALRPGRGWVLGDAAQGFTELFRGALGLLTRPEYFGKLGPPIAANLVGMALVGAAAWLGGWPLAQVLLELRPAWLAPAGGGAAFGREALAAVWVIVLVCYLGPPLLQAIAVPFVAPLAAALEETCIGTAPQPAEGPGWRELVANARAAARVAAVELLLLPPALVAAQWLPGLIAAVAVAAYPTALLWLEIPLARRGYAIDQRIRLVRRNWARASGFGLAFELGLAVPFLNALLLAPAATVAASALYLRFDKAAPNGLADHPPPP